MLLKRVQLGLLHVAVAMTLVPINSTLNRVMIKELSISAALVALLASLPYLFSPIQIAIGSFSDRHPLFGLRRTPYILIGILLCVLGVIVSPSAAFAVAEGSLGGWIFGIIAFGIWGLGYNLAAVSYLSLATEISGEGDRGKTISVMFTMMILSIIATALTLSRLLDPYSPEAMESAFRLVGMAALLLGVLGLLFLERKDPAYSLPASERTKFRETIKKVTENPQAKLFFVYLVILLAALLGQDILLEPFAGEAFDMPVQTTTRITSIWGGTFLLALVIAGIIENRVAKRTVAIIGGVTAVIGFSLITLSGMILNLPVFYAGVVLLGTGSGLSTVSNLALMLNMTTAGNVGLYIGAWGVANAYSRLIGAVLSGVVRDIMTQVTQSPIFGYVLVFAIEAGFLIISLYLLNRIDVRVFLTRAGQKSVLERAAIVNDG